MQLQELKHSPNVINCVVQVSLGVNESYYSYESFILLEEIILPDKKEREKVLVYR